MRLAFMRFVIALLSIAWPSLSAGADPTQTGRLPSGVTVPAPLPLGISVIGSAPSDDRKIVGIVFTQDNQTRVCSGLYVSARHILTAAHCTCGSSKSRVTNEDFDKGKFRAATFGAHFGNYNCDRRDIPRGDDLARLEITQPLWSTDIATACPRYSLLPAIKFAAHWFPTPPENISVAGYGFNGTAAQDLGSRQEAVVSLDSVLCATRQARGLSCLPFAEFIAGAPPFAAQPATLAAATAAARPSSAPVAISSPSASFRAPFPSTTAFRTRPAVLAASTPISAAAT